MPSYLEHVPYRDTEGKLIDFGRKRLRFWLDTVPPEIRRLEYELYKRNRKLISARMYQFDNKKRHGKFTVIPEFTADLAAAAWGKFKESFLKGTEQRKRFEDIITTAQHDLPILLKQDSQLIPEQKIMLIALGGSALYGPRRPNEKLTDIDINFLLNEETDHLNFDVFPDGKTTSKETPYHLFGTGYNEQARGRNRDLHWLLYPHFPLQNHCPDKELRMIIAQLVAATKKREGDILNRMSEMDRELKEKESELIIE